MQGHFPPALRAGIAASLEETAAAIETLGVKLCEDALASPAALTHLQSLDLAAQKLRCHAEIIAADDPLVAVETVKLEAVWETLAAAMAADAAP